MVSVIYSFDINKYCKDNVHSMEKHCKKILYVQEIYDPFVILMLVYIIIIVEGTMRCKPMFI
jgi:hypothetical protein